MDCCGHQFTPRQWIWPASQSPVVARADSSGSFILPVCVAVDDPSWYRAPTQSRCDRSGGPTMAVFEVPKDAELPPESLKMLVAFAAD